MDKRVVDHKGKEYKTLLAMCVAYGINNNLYQNRKKSGWDLEKILTTPIIGVNKITTDHRGNTFRNKAEMAKHWGIKIELLDSRLRNGWSLQRALETDTNGKYSRGKRCQDHKGVIYTSIQSMCEAYDINSVIFRYRKKLGWDLEKILTTPINRVCNIKDVDGKKYDNVSELYRQEKLERLKNGSRHRITSEDNGKVSIREMQELIKEKEVRDHEGKLFYSVV